MKFQFLDRGIKLQNDGQVGIHRCHVRPHSTTLLQCTFFFYCSSRSTFLHSNTTRSTSRKALHPLHSSALTKWKILLSFHLHKRNGRLSAEAAAVRTFPLCRLQVKKEVGPEKGGSIEGNNNNTEEETAVKQTAATEMSAVPRRLLLSHNNAPKKIIKKKRWKTNCTFSTVFFFHTYTVR